MASRAATTIHMTTPTKARLMMLIPLGVLSLGAVFSGMVFYNNFFGDHHKLEVFFGIAQAEAHASAEPGFSLISPAYAEGTTEEAAHGDEATTEEAHAEVGCSSNRVRARFTWRRQPCDRRRPPRAKVGQGVAVRGHALGLQPCLLFYIRTLSCLRFGETATPLYNFLLEQMVFRRTL